MKYTIDDILYSKDIDSDLYCPLCCSIMVESLSCLKGHNICVDCLKKQIQQVKPECPICCIPISFDSLCKNIFLQKYINNLKVYCPYKYKNNENNDNILIEDNENGCKEIITIEELNYGKHLKECKFQFIECKNNKKCGWYRKNEIEEHMNKECGYYLVKCYHCNGEFERQKLGDHLLTDCENIIISCRYKEGGCNKRFPRSQLSQHLQEDDNHNQFISNIINNHQSQLKTTSKKLKQLRISCEEMESKLINNDYSYNGKWIIKQWNKHYEQFKQNSFTNLIISPPIYLTPTKEFSLSLSADSVVNSVNCISIILSKQFQSVSTIQYSFEISNNQNTKSIKKEEKKKFSALIGSYHSIEFPTSEIYNINNKYINNDQLIIKFNIKILSIQDDNITSQFYNQDLDDEDEDKLYNNILITELEEE